MPKGYWISAYREIRDTEKLAAYAKLAGPAVKASGGRFLVRGGRMEAHEAGVAERTVVVEFDSFDAAVAAHESDGYKAALAELEGGVVRDFRIVEGAE
jgi:uncharacterized protein (DUF1330 family)